ncbi:MAG: type II CAAX endopeptidase family protein [bacterium]|nr:type II CAAX endopeptidase family protein [bacterium]
MEQPRGFAVWEIIYPFFLFEAIVLIIQEALVKILRLSWAVGLTGQAISTCVAIIVLWYRFIFKEKLTLTQKKSIFIRWKAAVMAIAATVISGVGWNLLILSIHPLRSQEQFRTANQYFYGSTLGMELVTLGIITPIAEELLFRGIIYQRLRKISGVFASVMISAVFFGVYHLNITQIIYACAIGILLALLMEAYGDVRIPMLGHMAINIVVVLNGELGILDRTILATPLQKNACMAICLVLTVVFTGVLGKKCKEK